MRNERHNCGGILKNKQVTITRKIDGLNYTLTVKGKQCTRCSEEVISRNTLRELEVNPAKSVRVNRRKTMGTLFTLDTPFPFAPMVGTMPDNTSYGPTADTGRFANAYS